MGGALLDTPKISLLRWPSGELIPSQFWRGCEKLCAPSVLAIERDLSWFPSMLARLSTKFNDLQNYFYLEFWNPDQLTFLPQKSFNIFSLFPLWVFFFFCLLSNFKQSRDQMLCPQINSPADGLCDAPQLLLQRNRLLPDSVSLKLCCFCFIKSVSFHGMSWHQPRTRKRSLARTCLVHILKV